MEIPERGEARHFLDTLTQQHVLYHRVTGELVYFPFTVSARVPLHTGEGGFAYLAADGSDDAMWCAKASRCTSTSRRTPSPS